MTCGMYKSNTTWSNIFYCIKILIFHCRCLNIISEMYFSSTPTNDIIELPAEDVHAVTLSGWCTALHHCIYDASRDICKRVITRILLPTKALMKRNLEHRANRVLHTVGTRASQMDGCHRNHHRKCEENTSSFSWGWWERNLWRFNVFEEGLSKKVNGPPEHIGSD